jgi:hypothetical protein
LLCIYVILSPLVALSLSQVSLWALPCRKSWSQDLYIFNGLLFVFYLFVSVSLMVAQSISPYVIGVLAPRGLREVSRSVVLVLRFLEWIGEMAFKLIEPGSDRLCKSSDFAAACRCLGVWRETARGREMFVISGFAHIPMLSCGMPFSSHMESWLMERTRFLPESYL